MRIIQPCLLFKKLQDPIWRSSLGEGDKMAAYVRMQSRVFLVHFASEPELCSRFSHYTPDEPVALLAVKETREVLGCACQSVASRPRKVILLPLHPAFVRSYLQYVVFNFGLPSTRRWGTFCSNSTWSPGGLSTWYTRGDQDNQVGSALRKRSKMVKILLVSSTTYLEDTEKAELGSSWRCDVIGQEAMSTCSCMRNAP